MNDNVSSLYSALRKYGYSENELGGSEEDFRNLLKDQNNRDYLYRYVSDTQKGGFVIGGQDEYNSRLSMDFGESPSDLTKETISKGTPDALADLGTTNTSMAGAMGIKPEEPKKKYDPNALSQQNNNFGGYAEGESGVAIQQFGEQKKAKEAEDQKILDAQAAELKKVRDWAEQTGAKEKLEEDRAELQKDLDFQSDYMQDVEKISKAFPGARAGYAAIETGKRVYNWITGWFDKDKRQASAAIAKIDDTLTKIDEASHADGGFLDKQVGGVYRGMIDQGSKISNWDLGVADATNGYTINQVLDKFEAGEQLTAREQKMLDVVAFTGMLDDAYEDQIGLGYKAGQGTAQSFGYMEAFMLGPGGRISDGIVNGALKLGGRGANYATRMSLLRAMAKRYGTGATRAWMNGAKVAGDMAGALGVEFTSGLPSTIANIEERKMGQILPGELDNGRITFGGVVNRDPNATRHGIAGSYLEYWSEGFGEYFDLLDKPLKAGLRKIPKYRELEEALTFASPNDVNNAFNAFRKQAKFSGFTKEWGEEIVNNIGNTIPGLTGDMNWSTDPNSEEWQNSIFNPDTNLELIAQLGVMCGHTAVIQGGTSVLRTKQLNKAMAMAEKGLATSFGPAFNEIKGNLDEMGGARSVDYIRELAKDGLIKNVQQLNDLLTYSFVTNMRRGINTREAIMPSDPTHNQWYLDDVHQNYMAAYDAGYGMDKTGWRKSYQELKDAEKTAMQAMGVTKFMALQELCQQGDEMAWEDYESFFNNYLSEGQASPAARLAAEDYINKFGRNAGLTDWHIDQADKAANQYRAEIAPASYEVDNDEGGKDRIITTATYVNPNDPNAEPEQVFYKPSPAEDGSSLSTIYRNGKPEMVSPSSLSDINDWWLDSFVDNYRDASYNAWNENRVWIEENNPKTQPVEVGLEFYFGTDETGAGVKHVVTGQSENGNYIVNQVHTVFNNETGANELKVEEQGAEWAEQDIIDAQNEYYDAKDGVVVPTPEVTETPTQTAPKAGAAPKAETAPAAPQAPVITPTSADVTNIENELMSTEEGQDALDQYKQWVDMGETADDIDELISSQIDPSVRGKLKEYHDAVTADMNSPQMPETPAGPAVPESQQQGPAEPVEDEVPRTASGALDVKKLAQTRDVEKTATAFMAEFGDDALEGAQSYQEQAQATASEAKDFAEKKNAEKEAKFWGDVAKRLEPVDFNDDIPLGNGDNPPAGNGDNPPAGNGGNPPGGNPPGGNPPHVEDVDITLDTPANARARGYVTVNGQRVYRLPAGRNVDYGADTSILFTTEDDIPARYAFIPINSGAASHKNGQRNVDHFFLDDAQPKNRTDKASSEDAKNIAERIKAVIVEGLSAYDGPPILNTRLEVIQGNNRYEGLSNLTPASAEKYKAMLAANAQKLGFDEAYIKQAVDSGMILVRIVDVNDAEAVRLGNKTRADLESGGTQTLDVVNVARLILQSGKTDLFISDLLHDPDPEGESSVSTLISTNGPRALANLLSWKIITQTQYQSAVEDGKLTDISKIAVSHIIDRLLFGEGNARLKNGYDSLNDTKKKSVINAIVKGLNAAKENNLNEDINTALELVSYGNSDTAFNESKDKDTAVAKLKGLLRSVDAFSNVPTATDLQINIAGLLKTGKAKDINEAFKGYYDAVAPVSQLDIFAENESLSKADAVKKFFGAELSDKTDDLAEAERIAAEAKRKAAEEKARQEAERKAAEEKARQEAEGQGKGAGEGAGEGTGENNTPVGGGAGEVKLTEDQIRSLGLDDTITNNAVNYIKGKTKTVNLLAYTTALNEFNKREKANSPEGKGDLMADAERIAKESKKANIPEVRETPAEPNTPADPLNAEMDKAMAEFNDALKAFGKPSKTISLSLTGLSNDQMEKLADLFVASAKVGYVYVKMGVRNLDQWLENMTQKLGRALKDATNWSDDDVREFLTEVYEDTDITLDDGSVSTLKDYVEATNEPKSEEANTVKVDNAKEIIDTYTNLKEKNPGATLLLKDKDNYYAFFTDAAKVSDVMGELPEVMEGVTFEGGLRYVIPESAFESTLAKSVRHGLRFAIADMPAKGAKVSKSETKAETPSKEFVKPTTKDGWINELAKLYHQLCNKYRVPQDNLYHDVHDFYFKITKGYQLDAFEPYYEKYKKQVEEAVVDPASEKQIKYIKTLSNKYDYGRYWEDYIEGTNLTKKAASYIIDLYKSSEDDWQEDAVKQLYDALHEVAKMNGSDYEEKVTPASERTGFVNQALDAIKKVKAKFGDGKVVMITPYKGTSNENDVLLANIDAARVLERGIRPNTKVSDSITEYDDGSWTLTSVSPDDVIKEFGESNVISGSLNDIVGMLSGEKNSPRENTESKNSVTLQSNDNTDNNGTVQELDGRSSTEGAEGLSSNEDGSLGESKQPETGGSDRGGVVRRNGGSARNDEKRTERLPGSTAQSGPVRNTNNYRADAGRPSLRSSAARFNANVEAIKLLKILQDSGLEPTEEEKATLASFTGWGGLGGEITRLKDKLLPHVTTEEYEQIALSANSSYYTPNEVITQLWTIAEKLGFKGGKILEGSAGIGNILSLMPEHISNYSDIQAVEIEPQTGAILEMLYPDADVKVQGFEQTKISNGSVDLAITNVPFVTGLHVIDESGDKDLSNRFKNIHDFCIAKNVRKLAPGGLGIFISSSGTLDKSSDLRSWLIHEGDADVIGAFRLHNATFIGAPVTSDIIVVRKRVGGEKSPQAIDVSSVTSTRTAEYHTGKQNKKGEPIVKPVSVVYNRYFEEHPENMGGEMAVAFEKGDSFRPEAIGLYPFEDVDTQNQRLQEWAENFDEEYTPEKTESAEEAVARANEKLGPGVKEGSLVVNAKGEICIARLGEAVVPIKTTKKKNGTIVVEKIISDKRVKDHTKGECLTAYNRIKEALKAVIDYQTLNEGDAGLQKHLDKLNRVFDSFVNTYGHLYRSRSLAFLRHDVDYASILSLEEPEEKVGPDKKKKYTFKKMDIFRKRVVVKTVERKPENIRDGILASVFKTGNVDIDYIAEALGLEKEDAKAKVLETGLAFENPATGNVEVSFEYLSGNVREKLQVATDSNVEGKYNKNIAALEKVIPLDIPMTLIGYNIGSSWIDSDIFVEYILDRTGQRVSVESAGGTWSIKDAGRYGGEKNNGFGVYSEQFNMAIPGTLLIECAMRNTTHSVQITVKNPDGSKATQTDKEATQACNNKIAEIRQDFKTWSKDYFNNHPDVAQKFEKEYNNRFNNYVAKSIPEEFVPDHFPGAVVEMGGQTFNLYPHQGKAVIRGTMEPLLLAHEVGTGKTFTLITTAMEMRRLGTANKPMIVVQNATVGQFVSSAKALYPAAKIITIPDTAMNEEGRKAFYSRIKYNDWDMIVVPQSVLDKIPDNPERKIAYIQDKIAEKEAIMETVDDNVLNRNAKAEIEKLQEELAKSTEELTEKKARKNERKAALAREKARVKAVELLDREIDDVEDFDEMGIDAILIDEAHEYKHLGFSTAMQRGVKGVDPSPSKKSQSVYLKIQAVKEKTGGKNVVFATGTPISNTAAEVWTFMKYLMPSDMMEEYGMSYFDDFVRNFGNISQTTEFSTSGKFKEVNRFLGYDNLPELIRIWSSVSDTVLTENQKAVIAKLPQTVEGGNKATQIFLPQSASLRRVMRFVREELERFEKMDGKEKRNNSHIPLVMFGTASKAAIDPRLVWEGAPDEPNSKTNKAVEETLKALEESKKYNGTVAIFSDSYQKKKVVTENGRPVQALDKKGRPKFTKKGDPVYVELITFNLYEEIARKLIEKGVPENQIAIMRSGMSVKDKEDIFSKVNSGDIRVIMGSTKTLGTGVNIQERLYCEINVDVPNRPMDYTQRLGRILRQGNLHKLWGIPVKVLNFGTEDSLDITGYQRLEIKGKIAHSIMEGSRFMENSMTERFIEEEEESFGDVVATLSGSQFALLKSKYERDLRKYQARKQQWESDQIYIHRSKPRLEGQIRYDESYLEKIKGRLDAIRSHFPEGKVSTIKIGENTYPSVEAMADYLAEYNRKQNARMDEMRAEARQSMSGADISEETSLDVYLDGVKFTIRTKYYAELEKKFRGEIDVVCHKRSYFDCPELNMDGISFNGSNGNYLKSSLLEIIEDIASGKDYQDRYDREVNNIAREKKELEELTKREGKPFEYEEELANAEKKVKECTEKMVAEMQAKDEKYREMDAELGDSGETFSMSDDDFGDDEDEEGEEEDSHNPFRTTDEIPVESNKSEIVRAAENIAGKLNTEVNVLTNGEELNDTDIPAEDKITLRRIGTGYYDARTGKVYLYAPNISNADEAIATALHEIVGHKNLRQLFGKDEYNKTMMAIYGQLPKSVRDQIARRAVGLDYDFAEATDEYLADFAEKNETPMWWEKVITHFNNFLRRLGLNVKLTDGDVRYLLWQSKRKLEKGDIIGDAERRVMRKRWGINQRNVNKGVSLANQVKGEAGDALVHEGRFSLRKKPFPKDRRKVYKLMRLLPNGNVQTLFIGREEYEVGKGKAYDADSPDFSQYEKLPEGYAYELDKDGNVLNTKEITRKGGNISRLPSKKVIENSNERETRWITVTLDAKGEKAYHNIGINGSGGVTTYAMRPGIHAGNLPVMTQIGSGTNRDLRDDDLVFVEGYIAYGNGAPEEALENGGEITSHIPVDGGYEKGTSSFVTKGVTWYISGAFEPVRIISDDEARAIVDDFNKNIKDAGEPDVPYDYSRRGGRKFYTDTMQVEEDRDKNPDNDPDGGNTPSGRFRKKGNMFTQTRQEAYDEQARSARLLSKTAVVDYLAPVLELQKMVAKSAKKVGKKLLSTQDVYNPMLALPSVNDREMKMFDGIFVSKLSEAIYKIVGRDGWNNKEAKDLVNYAIVKHGIERNRDMAVRAHLQGVAKQEYDDQINEYCQPIRAELLIESENLNNLREERNNLTKEVAKIKARVNPNPVELALKEGELREKRNEVAEQSAKVKELNIKLRDVYAFPKKYDLQTEEEIRDGHYKEWYDRVAAVRAEGLPWRESQEKMDKIAVVEFQTVLGAEYSGIPKTLESAKAHGMKPYDFVERYESKVSADKLDNLWQAVRDMSEWTLNKQRKSMLSDAHYLNDQKRRYEFYVPLRGFADPTAQEMYDYLGEEFHETGNPMAAAHGRLSKPGNPFAFLLNVGYRSIASGNRNIAMQNFWNLANGHNTDGLLVPNRTWIRYDEPMQCWVEALPDIPGDTSDADEIRRIIEDFNNRMKELEQMGMAMQEKNGMPLPPYKALPGKQRSQHHVTVFVGGKRRVVTVVGSPLVAQALNGALNPDSALLDVTRGLNNFMAGAFTSYNFSFSAANLVRDTMHSNMRSFITESPEYWARMTARQFAYGLSDVDVFEGGTAKRTAKTAAVLAGTLAENVGTAGAAGTTKLVKNWAKMFGLINWYHQQNQQGTRHKHLRAGVSALAVAGCSEQTVKNFRNFMDHGGATGMTFVRDQYESLDHLQDMINEASHGKFNLSRLNPMQLFEFCELAGQASELVNRFIAYETSLEMGRTEKQAIADAKEITLNFQRKGAGLKMYRKNRRASAERENTWWENKKYSLVNALAAASQYGRANIIFWNAHVQGSYQLYDMFKKHPVKSGFAFVGVPMVAAGIMIPLLNDVLLPALYASLGGGDDDDEYNYYDELSDYDRQNNICIRLPKSAGGGYVKIPLTPELQTVYGIGDSMGGWVSGKREIDALTDVVFPVTDIFAPTSASQGINADGNFLKGAMQYGAGYAPSALQPFLHSLTNTRWNGRPLRNETNYNDKLPEWERTFRSTSPALTWASKMLNNMTGGDSDMHTKGWANVNPADINEFLTGITGGWASSTISFLDMLYTGYEASQSENADQKKDLVGDYLYNQTILHRFLVSGAPGKMDQQLTGLYYKEVTDFTETIQQRNTRLSKEIQQEAMRGGDVQGASDRLLDFTASPEYELYKILTKNESVLSGAGSSRRDNTLNDFEREIMKQSLELVREYRRREDEE